MAGRRKRQEESNFAEGELNLVPYLDIMMNLIMFMLFSFEVALELKLIQFNPPAAATTTDIGTAGQDEEKPLLLTVTVTASGHSIVTDQPGAGAETIPKKGDKYDYEELSKHLAKLKFDSGIKLDDNIVLASDPQIEYSVVVATLDAMRSDKDARELFPFVTLGMGVGTQ